MSERNMSGRGDKVSMQPWPSVTGAMTRFPPGENLIAHVLTLLLNNVAASFLNIGVIGVICVLAGIMSCDDIAGHCCFK